MVFVKIKTDKIILFCVNPVSVTGEGRRRREGGEVGWVARGWGWTKLLGKTGNKQILQIKQTQLTRTDI